MNVDITTLPTSELLEDRAASLADITYCEKLATGSERYRARADVNRKIVAAIDAELDRRRAPTPEES